MSTDTTSDIPPPRGTCPDCGGTKDRDQCHRPEDCIWRLRIALADLTTRVVALETRAAIPPRRPIDNRSPMQEVLAMARGALGEVEKVAGEQPRIGPWLAVVVGVLKRW